MGELKLQSQGGLFGKEQPVHVRKLSSAVNAEDIKGMTKDNNLDEIVVENPLGDRHVVYADELSVKGGKLPKVGDTVNLPFLDEAVKVIHVDDEINEDHVLGGLGFGLGMTGLLAGRLLGGRPAGNDTDIKRLSGPAEVSEKELNWAESTQNKSLSGEKPSKADQSRFNDIMSRYAEQQKRDNSPYRPDSKLSQGDLNWALQLEKKVSKLDYQPNVEETERYTQIARLLTAELSAADNPPAPPAPVDSRPRKTD
ncbi:MAG: hypothetical protein CVV27_00925 [Candidatus Melainabacteria bacterium HGW-Melainabacteria-1]|nr:MAG: hypothetical protein CVV27_00925 [Candidatus Melainabacteria bacterium HGW-Melainabacteria-1]